MKHTPLPWREKYYGAPDIVSAKGEHICTVDTDDWNENQADMEEANQIKNEANAEFIVKACNAYPKLVEASQFFLSDMLNIRNNWGEGIEPEDAIEMIQTNIKGMQSILKKLGEL